jgi:hypothetical protein
MPANRTMLMTANEAASVTGVPLRQVHRIIDAGLLGGAVKRRRHSARYRVLRARCARRNAGVQADADFRA